MDEPPTSSSDELRLNFPTAERTELQAAKRCATTAIRVNGGRAGQIA